MGQAQTGDEEALPDRTPSLLAEVQTLDVHAGPRRGGPSLRHLSSDWLAMEAGLIATSLTSTLQEEITEATEAGFLIAALSGGRENFEHVALMERVVPKAT